MSELLGVNVLLEGPSGTGKTTSLKTLLKVPDLEVFALFLEPRFDVLSKDFLDKIHWRYIPQATASWSTLIGTAKQVNLMTNEAMQKAKGIDQGKCQQFIQVLEQMANFRDSEGREWGDVTTWGTDRVLIIDGLTGINKMARSLGTGMKPILTQPDWGVAMQTVLQLVDTLTQSTKCHFILIAHVEREVDEVGGGVKIMTSTLGRKLAPQLPINFGDVILSCRNGSEFYWDTANGQADLKPGNLPISGKLPQDFSALFEGWKKKGGVIRKAS
jgi:hypothetical protein